jgi:hypothetical protein
MKFSLFNLSRVYAQIGVVWMELLQLGDGWKSVKLGVDVWLDLCDLVPTLRLKRSQCVSHCRLRGVDDTGVRDCVGHHRWIILKKWVPQWGMASSRLKRKGRGFLCGRERGSTVGRGRGIHNRSWKSHPV